MALADAPSTSPPTPDVCEHTVPVVGVMAHEYAHYQGAEGPEGLRRTVTFYGPVVGGLPIDAWHCPTCGLLRLDYPDGRVEERRLYPGPQPGLIAEASTVSTDSSAYGMQARVSGLSASPHLLEQAARLAIEPGINRGPRPWERLPRIGMVTACAVGMLATVFVGLVVAGVMAVAGPSTPDAEAPVIAVIAAVFGGFLLLTILTAAFQHFFPAGALSPSPAQRYRETPVVDGATRTITVLLALVFGGLIIAGAAAVSDWTTPSGEAPLVIGLAVLGGLALMVAVLRATVSHLGHSRG